MLNFQVFYEAPKGCHCHQRNLWTTINVGLQTSLCRREGISANLYYRWSKDFLEAGKKRLAGDTAREANSHEVKEQVVQQALEQTELSPRELACRIIDTKEYFISESSVYRFLKSHYSEVSKICLP